MKFNIISAALLLLTVINLSSGRTIQKRSPYGKETDLLDSVKKGLIPVLLISWQI